MNVDPRGLLLAAVLSLPAMTHATIIDFNDTPSNNYWNNPVTSGDYVFTDLTGEGSIGTDTSVDGIGPDNGTNHLMDWFNSNIYDPARVRMEAISGDLFSLIQLDFYSGYNNGNNIATSLTIAGYDGLGGLIASASFFSAAGDFANAWGTLVLSGFDSLAYVEFTTAGNQNRSGYDNIVVAEVPEPTALSLLGLGLLFFGFGRRHRKA